MSENISKSNLNWLTYNTEICNVCDSVDECFSQDIVFRLYREHHLQKIHEIFSDYEIKSKKDSDNYVCVKIRHFTIGDLYQQIYQNGGDMFLNRSDGKTYYIPINKKKYRRMFNSLSTRMLANLPPNKKMDILKSLSQRCYMLSGGRKSSEESLSKKSNKILALLQIPIPQQFFEDERRKVRLIVAEIAKIPDIRKSVENFADLPTKKQYSILHKVCEITAKYNNIDVPNLMFLTQKQIDKDEGLDEWVAAEAYAYEKNVCINTDFLKKIDGAQALSLAWHETTHVAQATADYSKYPVVEEMFNHSFDFLQKMSDTYIFHPQEKIVYALEKQFIENIVENIGIKTNDSTFQYSPEYDVASQYVHRSLKAKTR